MDPVSAQNEDPVSSKHITDSHKSNSEEIAAMKMKFNDEMEKYVTKLANTPKKLWTAKSISEAIDEITSLNSNLNVKRNSRQYSLLKKYKTMEVGGDVSLVKKRGLMIRSLSCFLWKNTSIHYSSFIVRRVIVAEIK